MCTGFEIAALATTLAGTGAGIYNQQRTLNRQDQQAASAIQTQGRVQRQVDSRVDDEVRRLEGSTAADERAQALEGYMDTLSRNRRSLEGGLAPTIGSDTYRASSAQAAGDVNTYAQRAADLMSRIDAPVMQRQGEAFGYGRLATDIGTLARNAQGESFLDEMRMRAIRKNPLIDAAAGAMTAYGGSMAGRASGAGYTGRAGVQPYMSGTGGAWTNAYGAGG